MYRVELFCRYFRALSQICRALLRVCSAIITRATDQRPRIADVKESLQICRALLRRCTALLRVYRALLWICRTCLRICRAFVWMYRALIICILSSCVDMCFLCEMLGLFVIHEGSFLRLFVDIQGSLIGILNSCVHKWGFLFEI